MSDVIAAVSTPLVSAGIGVIRVSGDGAAALCDRVFKAAGGKKLDDIEGYRALYGTVFDADGAIDEAVALRFRAPHSFTGEDVVELSCHGSVYILRRTLSALIAAGARMAKAGEFTRRAFENGKMDLTAAESVMSLIGAQSSAEHAAALSGREGALYRRVNEIRDGLIKLAGHLSAWVDFPDEEVPEVDESELKSGLFAAERDLRRLLSGFESGRLLREGIDTVIVGRPNVGKSTLMNMLCGCDRSIVTSVAGTTRDIVEESVTVGGIKLRLSDTAGIRDTADAVERIGVDMAQKRIQTAALIIAVFDGSQELSDDDAALIGSLAGRRAVAVINKDDLDGRLDADMIKRAVPLCVSVSAKSCEGADRLAAAIAEACGIDGIDPAEGIMTTERQRDCAHRALCAVDEGIAALENGLTFDAVGVMLDEALAALSELSGERVSDAVVDEVFSTFCVGK